MYKKIALLSACALALSGCATSNNASSESPKTIEAGQKMTVLTSLYPIEYLAKEVGGDKVQVSSLAPAGVEPHDLELSLKQVSEIPQANLVVYLKGFQSSVDKAIDQAGKNNSFDITKFANVMPVNKDEHDHEETEEHGHEGHHHDHESLAFDPHFWLNPNNMASVATALGDRMAQANPENADYFKKNAQELSVKLKSLATDAVNKTKQCAHRTFITTHEAFAYLGKLTNLKQVGLSGLDPEAAPSPERLAKISKLAKDNNLTTIFTEELVSPKVAETLSKDLGIKTEVLSPIETQTDAGKDYSSMFTEDIEKLSTALECK
ncbi:metal ABC transporter substrate-binding protein [Actinomycetaceae bacterium TAE3-ERU4]|nr:metal ABC transporter substrate-binding protein [Actinomycetaceae bacterium TAE3-ERU4]